MITLIFRDRPLLIVKFVESEWCPADEIITLYFPALFLKIKCPASLVFRINDSISLLNKISDCVP